MYFRRPQRDGDAKPPIPHAGAGGGVPTAGGEASRADGPAGGGQVRGEACGQGGPGIWGGRLNLLLSTAPWQDDPWSLALPRLLEPMGVMAHRAGTAREAERVIRTTTIHIAVIDLAIPLGPVTPGSPIESGGPRVLDLLSRLDAPPPTVVLKAPRSHRDETREMQTALRCGAFAVVDRAGADLESMLAVMERCLVRFYAGRWPGGGASK